jgi:peptidoglycan hydrolase-like protein with peptidoglycan-binding domain
VLAVGVATGAAYGVSRLTDVERSGVASQSPAGTSPAPTTPPTPTAIAEPTPRPRAAAPTAAPVTLALKPLLAPGDTGEQVRELQHRLQQLLWYAPKMTGRFDEVTVEAVKGFQAKREIPVTGEVDRTTWQRLVSMTRTPTHDEKYNILRPGPTILGPGASGDQVRELQARLKQIGWFFGDVTDYYGDTTTESVRGFQAKREIPVTGEVDQRTMDRLVAMTREPTEDEKHNRYPAATAPDSTLDPRCQTGRVLCIDKSTNSLRWVVDGAVLSTVDVRFGSELTPTREGTFSVTFKSRDHVSSLYDTPMPYAMFFSGGQAVHYSPDFAANGYNGASHGCVNVRDLGAIASLFDQVYVGDRVVVYWS